MPRLSTIAAFGFADFHPPAQLRFYRRFGCRSCQFYRNEADPPDPASARKIAEDCGLPIDSVHGVFGPTRDPSSPDEAMRRSTIETYRAEGELALQLGGSMIIVHPAAVMPKPITSAKDPEGPRAAALRRSLQQLADLADAQGVTYLVENVPHDYHFGWDPARLAEMIRQLNHQGVRMCFDVGHAHMTGDAAAALEACRDVVSYLHINDNDGRSDSHLVPGRGTIDWDRLTEPIARLPADTPAMLELFESEANLAQLIESGFKSDLERWLALESRL